MERDLGVATSFSRDQEIFGEGEPADYLYRLKSGCIRTYATLSNGRRLIASFYLPGEYFGLESEKLHSFSAEAVTSSVMYVIKRSALAKRSADNDKIAIHLLALTALELRRTRRHVLLLLKSARERVGQFLLEMAERENRERDIELPMGRQDIADYLGLTIETVSRVLTRLEKTSAISLPSNRRVVLRNRFILNLEKEYYGSFLDASAGRRKTTEIDRELVSMSEGE